MDLFPSMILPFFFFNLILLTDMSRNFSFVWIGILLEKVMLGLGYENKNIFDMYLNIESMYWRIISKYRKTATRELKITL